MNNNNIVKQISISFENKEFEQKIAKFIKDKKKSIGVSEYIKQLVIKDMINSDDNLQ